MVSPDFEVCLKAYIQATLDQITNCEETTEFNKANKDVRINDDDCSDFDVMEAQIYWDEVYRKKHDETREALLQWLQINIDHTPIVQKTELYYELHGKRDCYSSCADCIQRDKLQTEREIKAKQNKHPAMLEQMLNSRKIGSVVTLKCLQFTLNGYLWNGLVTDETKTTILHFVKTKYKFGVLMNDKKNRVLDLLCIFVFDKIWRTFIL